MFEESGQEVVVLMQDGQGVGWLLAQVCQIASGEVGLRSILAVAPTILDGIQFRTVGRQELEAEPGRMFDREILGRFEMRGETVPDEYDPTAKTVVQVAKKRNQQRRIDIRAVQLEGEIHPMATGRNRNRTDSRDSIKTGVLPDGAQVRRHTGWSMKPETNPRIPVRRHIIYVVKQASNRGG